VTVWLVKDVPPWLLLPGLILLISGGAVLTQRYVRQRFPGLKGDTHNEVMRFIFTVIAVLYAFLSGFMINALWGQINAADARAAIEGSTGMQQARSLTMFDQPDSDRIRQRLLEYERTAVAEWPLVASGQTQPEADKALQGLYTAYQGVQPRNDVQSKFLVIALNNLDKMSAGRTERVTAARTATGPPLPLWAVNLVIGAMLLGCGIIFGGVKSAFNYTMVGALGVLIASVLFVIVEMSHPYLGEIATSPEPLRQVVAFLSPSPA
jgi:hypothetical protein